MVVNFLIQFCKGTYFDFRRDEAEGDQIIYLDDVNWPTFIILPSNVDLYKEEVYVRRSDSMC